MSLLSNIKDLLFRQGIYEFYFPFLLTFAIFYALIRRTRVFGKDKTANRISLVVSLVAAFYVMAFSPIATPISSFFSSFFAGTSVILVFILSLLMITMMLFGPFWTKIEDMEWWGQKIKWFILTGALLALLLFVLSGGIGLFGIIIPPNLWIPGISGDDLAIILLILLTGVIVFAVQSEEIGEEEDSKKHGTPGGG
ncbi:MAG: hypothetical protein QXY45_00275 [Candidatus Aenigmatarchaeota archaeon]